MALNSNEGRLSVNSEEYTDLEAEINVVKNDIRQFKCIAEAIVNEIEIKSKQLSTIKGERDVAEFRRKLESLHFKLVSYKCALVNQDLRVQRNGVKQLTMDSSVHSFQKKLQIQRADGCESEIKDDDMFEIDSSPDSGDEELRLLDSREGKSISKCKTVLNGNSFCCGSSATEAENDTLSDYDFQDDLRWKDSLFNLRFKLDGEQCEEQCTSKDSQSVSKKLGSASGSTSGVHSRDNPNSDTLVKQVAVQGETKIHENPRVPVGVMIPVTVAHVINPSLFWLHYNPRLNDEILTKLQKTQNVLFRTGNWRVNEFNKNMYVAGMYSKDNFWYRAEIRNVVGTNSNNKLQLEVYYIDYGNSEILTEDDVTILSPDFLKCEPQAVRCCLTHISENAKWSQEDVDLFKTIIEGSFSLSAYFFAGMPDENGDLLYSVEIFNGSTNIVDFLPDQRNR